MKKKIIFLILLLFPIFVNAEEITKISLNEITSSPGNNITINLKLDNKQEFGVLTARIHYDNTKLEYVGSELIGLKKAALKGTDKNTDKGIVVVYGISLNEKSLMKDNGNIATIEFKIKDNVTEDIPLTLEIKDFSRNENTSLKYETTDGIIHIKNNITTVDKDTKTTIIDNIKEELKKQGIDNNDITISSSDDRVATVDDNGNIEFKDNGNVDIIVKDKDGKDIYTTGYFVKDKISNNLKLPIIVSIIVIIIIVTIICLRRRKCLKKLEKDLDL